MAKSKSKKKPEDLTSAIVQLRKDFGDDVITTLTEKIEIDTLPTGIPGLDMIIGQPGIPRGRITQIWGRESTGKSLIAETIAGNVQKAGGTVLYIDYEYSLAPKWLETLGIELGPTFLVAQPDSMEEGFEIARTMIETGKIDLVVFDAIGSMLPKATAERDAGDQTPGGVSLPLSIALNQLQPIIKNFNVAAIFINHVRNKIPTGWSSGGSTETMAGGNALRFYTHVLIKLRRRQLIKGTDGYRGMEVIARCEKNKVGIPFKEVELKLHFGAGFDASISIGDLLEEAGIVEVGRTGWVTSKELGIKVRGRDTYLSMLKDDEDLRKKATELLAESGKVDSTALDQDVPRIESIEMGEPG